MNPESLFSLLNTIAIIGWLGLFIAPKWKGTLWIVRSGVLSLVLAVSYLILFIYFAQSSGGLNLGEAFSSLKGIIGLLSNEYAMLVGWAHYLAFDLFVGAWIVGNAITNQIPHYLRIPCLFFTLMTGPIGFLLYFIVKSIYLKQLKTDIIA